MKAIKGLFSLRNQEFDVRDGVDGELALAFMKAYEANSVGVRINSMLGTAIAGTLSGAYKILTRSAGFWIKSQTIKVGTITGTFVVGEAITQATSSAAGVIARIELGGDYSYITIDTITVAAFTGTYTITGSTSSASAAPVTSGIETELEDLSGSWAFAHVSGTTTLGSFVKIVSNTATAITCDEAMPTTATAVIIFPTEEAALAAMDLASAADDATVMLAEDATTATYVMASNNDIKFRVVLVDTTSNDVLITLPNIVLTDYNQYIMIFGVDATTNSIDVQAYSAGQTLDGTDISSGGTPLATIDADGDYIIIHRVGNVWETAQNGIS